LATVIIKVGQKASPPPLFVGSRINEFQGGRILFMAG